MEIYEKLLQVQINLKAPKGQYNNFGKYKYRNCEDILESVKPLLNENKLTLTISDDIVLVGDRFYVKAIAKIIDVESGKSIENVAFAREEESKKGMDGSQVTGASSSYARKYALNGLFAIDDTKDADTLNSSKEYTEKNVVVELVSVEQLEEMKQLGVKFEGVLSSFKISKIEDLTSKQAQYVIDAKKKAVAK